MVTFIKNLRKRNKAFTLFLSLLVSSLVLAIGFSIGNIILKQLRLSATGGASQIAFYAADSAAECALFWDRKDGGGFTVGESPFSPITPDDSASPMNFECGSGAQTGEGGRVYGTTKICNNTTCGPLSQYATTTFYIDFRDRLDSAYRACAFVTIAKKYDADTGAEDTTVDARGYNTDLVEDSGSGGYGGYGGSGPGLSARCNLDRNRVVERGLLLSY